LTARSIRGAAAPHSAERVPPARREVPGGLPFGERSVERQEHGEERDERGRAAIFQDEVRGAAEGAGLDDPLQELEDVQPPEGVRVDARVKLRSASHQERVSLYVRGGDAAADRQEAKRGLCGRKGLQGYFREGDFGD